MNQLNQSKIQKNKSSPSNQLPIEKLTFETPVIDFSKNNEIFVIANFSSVKVYDLNTLDELVSLNCFNVTSVLVYKNWIIFASSEDIYFYDIFNFKEVKKEPFNSRNFMNRIWNIQVFNGKVYFPSNIGLIMIYDEKTDKFSSIQLKDSRLTSLCVYKDLLYVICSKRLYIMDVENNYQSKKEFQLKSISRGIAVNDENIFISDENGIVYVYNHEIELFKSIYFSESKNGFWLSLVNNYLICGTCHHVMIYNILKDEKILVPNPYYKKLWCVKPFEEDNQIIIPYENGIMYLIFLYQDRNIILLEKLKIL